MTHRRSALKKMSRQAKAVFVAMGLLVGSASVVNAASTGNVDTTWAANGVFAASVFNPDETRGVATVALAGGKTLHLARQSSQNIAQGFGLFQLTSTGALDTSFSTDGWLKQGLTIGGVTYVELFANNLNVLSDGSILVAGSVRTTDSKNGLFVAKFTSAGVLDTSFDSDGFSSVTPDTTGMGRPAISISSTGKIYAWFTTNVNRIIRLNANGTPDTGFNSAGEDFLEGLVTSGVLGQTEVGAFSVNDSVTPPVAYAAGVHIDRGGNANSSAIVYKVKFQSTAVLDTSYSGTSNFTGETNPTLGYVRVDLGDVNLQLKGAVMSNDGIVYAVGGANSKAYAAAIDVNLRKRHDSFGSSGVSNLVPLGLNSYSSLRVSGAGATRTLLVTGFNSSFRPIVMKYVNDVLDAGFGTAGVATMSNCGLTEIGDVALTTAADGGIVVIGNVNSMGAVVLPQTPQVIRLGAGSATNTCGASGGGGSGPSFTLPLLTSAVITEEAGLKAKVTVTGLVDGAEMIVYVVEPGVDYSNAAERPAAEFGKAGELTFTTSGMVWRNSSGVLRAEPFVIGKKYEFILGQRKGDEYSDALIQEFTFTGKVAVATTTTTTTVAPAPAVVPGVTVTDTKVYAAAAPKKVAEGSAIAVMTPAQAKTRDLKSLTPTVCLPAEDDLVFIKTGRCVAQVVSERTGDVLRTLRTRVVEDEVSELNVGNAIVTLTPIYFDGATAEVDAKAKKRLQSIKDRISAAGTVLLVGHSGILMGNTPENQEMGRARAIATRNELRDMGAKGPFYFTSAGALAPATTKMTQAAQAKNRRVVIVLIP